MTQQKNCKKICPISSNCCGKDLSENKKSLDVRLKKINEKIIRKSKKPLTLFEKLVGNADKEKLHYSETVKSFFLGLQCFGTKRTLELMTTFGLKPPSSERFKDFLINS